LFNAEVSGGGEGVEGEINGGGAMRVPAPSLAAIGSGLVLLRHDGDLSAVQELQQQQENLVADGVHGDHAGRARSGGGRGSRSGGGVEAGRRVGAAEEFPEEEATRGQDAAVRVDETALDLESDVAEGLAIDEKVEVVEGERSQRVFEGHGDEDDECVRV